MLCFMAIFGSQSTTYCILQRENIIMRYNNYHKHSHYSNYMTPDSITKPESFIERAIELGQDTYFTTEHGYQGDLFTSKTLCDKYNMKLIYGVEAYYADDMYDKTNRATYHIVLIAMNDYGRRQINSILSKANVDGYYYKPRIDLNCLLSLNPDDVVITTACIMSRLFKGDDWEKKFFLPVFEHFKDNFYLEVQSHNDDKQASYNFDILRLKDNYGCKLIHGNDSHYIRPEDSKYRDFFCKGKGITYEDESGFILDYPDSDTIVQRYKEQGVLTDNDISEALNNTLVFDNCEPLNINKKIKIPITISNTAH